MENNSEDRELLKALNDQGSGINIQDILEFLWRLKWVLLLSVAVFASVAYVNVKIQTPTYTARTKVMFIDYQNDNSSVSVVEEITSRRQGGRKDDEMIVLRSPSLMTKVVEKLGLNVRYYQYRLPMFHSSFPLFRDKLNIKQFEFYGNSPFQFDLTLSPYLQESQIPSHIQVKFCHGINGRYMLKSYIIDGKETKFDDKTGRHRYGDTIQTGVMRFVVDSPDRYGMIEGDTYQADWYTPYVMGEYFASKINASLESSSTNNSQTNVLLLSTDDSSPERARDILDVLVSEYNIEAREYKSQSSINSIKFIDERLDEISGELDQVEMNYTGTRQNIEYDSNTKGAASTSFDYEQQLTDLELQKVFLDMIKTEVYKRSENAQYDALPVNLGVQDGGLSQALAAYNDLVAERSRLMTNSSNNPRVVQMVEQIVEALESIKYTIHNLETVFQVREKELNRRLADAKKIRQSIPTRQLGMSEVARRQQIIEPLYLQLNQKREELQLFMFTIADNVRVIEPAMANYSPIAPNTKKTMRMSILAGFLLPIVIVLARKFLRRKVETKEDIKKRVQQPVLVTIPKGDGQLVDFTKDGRSNVAESFRMLRSNLMYMPGKVIQVTSSVSGEGKSFVAANLALTLAQTKQKVAMVGLDLRKPAITRMFGDMHEKGHSIVRYLLGYTRVDDIAVSFKSGGVSLDVYYPGSVPPNPAEMLTQPQMKTLMDYLRANYDYVIIDSAPYFPVTDSAIVNPYADVTLYVVRADYTDLRMVDELAELFDAGRLKNVGIVLNGLDITARKYYYGYSHGNYYGYGNRSRYGYGYGHYGYGYGYEPEPSQTEENKD